MRTLALLCFATAALLPADAAESCTVIHGRAHVYGGDGQLRIWHVGTHHDYEPDESSWTRVLKWLEAGVKSTDRPMAVDPASELCLFADFVICPTEPFKKGSVQQAKVKSASRKHYVNVGEPRCFDRK